MKRLPGASSPTLSTRKQDGEKQALSRGQALNTGPQRELMSPRATTIHTWANDANTCMTTNEEGCSQQCKWVRLSTLLYTPPQTRPIARLQHLVGMFEFGTLRFHICSRVRRYRFHFGSIILGKTSVNFSILISNLFP